MNYVVGIDVGTTRTSAAIAHPGHGIGEIEVVNLADRSSAVPSVLYVGDDGVVVVGEAAERRAVTEPDHVVREFKRRIGDPTPLVVGGHSWAPEELSARLARWVVDRVAQREGGAASRIAVTHPASWGAHKKDLFGGALAQQGLSVMFLAEPQAAALHYAAAERVEAGSTIAVYDLGGGTFDAAVVHKDGAGTFGLLGRPEGIERLGGVDFDEIVFEHVRAGLPEAFANLDEDDPAVLTAVAAVRRECTEAKEALSSDTEVTIPVLMPAGRGSVRLHRSEFEAMIRPQVEETVAALRRAITSAGCPPEQLTAVLLVGGSSRIPLVGELVSQQLGRPVAVDADPRNAIAKGAALAMLPAAVSSWSGAQVPSPRSETGARLPIGAGAPGIFASGTGGFPGPSAPGPHGTGAGAPQRSGAMPVMPAAAPPVRTGFPDRPAVGYGHNGYAGGYGAEYDAEYDGGDYGADHSGGYEPGGAAYERDYGQRPQPARRSAAMLVSAGGAVAAVAVVAMAFLLPHGSVTTVPTGRLSTGEVASSPSPTPVPTTVPPPTTEPTHKKIVVVPPKPVPTTTVAPPTTTVPPTSSTTATPTATSSTKTTTTSTSKGSTVTPPPAGDGKPPKNDTIAQG